MLAPKRVKLSLDHGPVNVQIVAFVDLGFTVVFNNLLLPIACSNKPTRRGALVQPLTYCAAVLGFHVFAQCADGRLECAAVVVFFVRLAVAFEASSLVDVKQCAGKFFGLERFIESLGT